MSDALRELLASFVVEVDKAGELAKGNAAVDALKERLTELQEAFKKVKAPAEGAGKAVADVFARAAQQAKKNIESIAALSAFGSARSSSTGFGDAFAAAAARAQAAQPQYGPTRETLQAHQRAEFVADAHPGQQYAPTRDTLNAGRAQMRAAEQAAAAYAQTLRGKLEGAVNAVRAGFNGGGRGGTGKGLIEGLATVRNGFLALGAGAAVASVKHLVDGIGGIGEGAAKLGVTSAQFQRLRVLAAQSDTSVDALGGAFRNLANAAAQPSKGTAAAFGKLGVSTRDANGELKSSNDLFWEVSRALAGVGNETERSALAQDLLGRSAQDLKAIFSSGTDAVDRQRAALAKLGVLSDETIASADEASDMWAGFGLAMMAAAEPLLKLLLPALVSLTKQISTGIEWLGKFLKQTDLVAGGLAILGSYIAVTFLPQLRLMVGLGGGAANVFLGMAGSIGKAALAFARIVAPIIILQDFLVWLRGGKSTFGRSLDAIFGEGASKGVLKALNDIGAAFADVWDWMLGKGQGDKVKALYKEITDSIGLMVHDLLVNLGVRSGKAGLDGYEAYQAEAAKGPQAPLLFDPSGFTAGPGGLLGQAAIPVPGSAPGAQFGPPLPPPAVFNVDNNVTINGMRVEDAKTAAREMEASLGRTNEALVAPYQ